MKNISEMGQLNYVWRTSILQLVLEPEVQSKFLTELLLTKREEAKLKLEFGLHPRKTFWLIKYYFPFTCKNVYFCFLFSPQIVKSILAFCHLKMMSWRDQHVISREFLPLFEK